MKHESCKVTLDPMKPPRKGNNICRLSIAHGWLWNDCRLYYYYTAPLELFKPNQLFPDLEELVHALSVLCVLVKHGNCRAHRLLLPLPCLKSAFTSGRGSVVAGGGVGWEIVTPAQTCLSLSLSLSAAGFRVPATSNTPPQQQLVSGTLTCAQPYTATTTGIMLGFTITVNEKC